MIIEEFVALLGYDVRGEGNLKKFNEGLRKTQELAGRVAIALAAAGVVAGGAMAAFGKGVISTSATFEGYQTSLETIEGSAEKAKQSMDWIANFAKKTPYELAGVTDAFIKMRSYGMDPMSGDLEMLGDTASAMNKPLMQAVEAFADATTFQFERLREFGVVATQKGDQVTFNWTKNGKSMSKVVKKTGAEVQKFLRDHWGQSFSGAMIRQSKTWNGMMANLGDAWQEFQKRVGDAGFFDYAKKRLGDFMDYLGQLDENGTLDRWAKALSDGLTRMAEIGTYAIERLIKVFEQLANFFADNPQIFTAFKWALIGLAAIAWPTAAAIAAIALAVEDFLTYLRGGDSVIGDFIAKINEIMPSLGEIPEKLKALDFHGVGKALGQAIVDGLSGIGKAIGEKIADVDWFYVIQLWIGALKAQVEILFGIFEGIGERLGQALLAGLQKIGTAITDWFMGLIPDWAKGYFESQKREPTTIEKAREAEDRRRKFEQNTQRLDNTPGISDLFDNPALRSQKPAPQPQGPSAIEKIWSILGNVNSHLAQMSAGAIDKAVNATISDNRQFPVSVSTVINQTVTTAVEGASAAASTVASAVNKAAVPDKARTVTGGSF